jgi:hypothetical protein
MKHFPLDIYQEAVIQKGVDNQIGQAMEELAELIVALNKWHWHRGPDTTLQVLEEVADVENVLEQIKYLIDGYHKVAGGDPAVNARDAIIAWKKMKLERLERELWPDKRQ